MEKRPRPVINRGALLALPVILIFLWVFLQGGMDQDPWRLLPPFAAVVALMIVGAILGARRRLQTLRRVSEELGLQFAEVGDKTSMHSIFNSRDLDDATPEVRRAIAEIGAPPAVQQAALDTIALAKARPGLEQSDLRALTLFQDVDRPRARNVMAGTLGGADALVFDYIYDTRHIDPAKSNAVSQTVAVFRFRGRTFPPFELSPEGFLKEGGQDIDFATHSEFSRRFRLRGDDETAVRKLFHSGVLAFFETLRDGFAQTIEGQGEYLVVYRGGRKLDPDAVKAFVEEATTVASTLGSTKR